MPIGSIPVISTNFLSFQGTVTHSVTRKRGSTESARMEKYYDINRLKMGTTLPLRVSPHRLFSAERVQTKNKGQSFQKISKL